MNVAGHELAVCSWSLQPKDMGDLVGKLKQIGLQKVQLGLVELVQLDDKRKHHELGQLRAGGIGFTGGMISFPGEDYSTIEQIRRTGGFVPDAQWPLRRKLAEEAARLAHEMGMKTVTAHVGFVPPHSDSRYLVIRDRIRELADKFASFGVDLLMETGQESAEELLEFLNDLSASNVGINFDPANMILYGAGEPISALTTLGRHVRHVHVKDGTPSSKPGQEWGKEVPFGTGNVKPADFLNALRKIGYAGPLAIEREAGNERAADVRFAIDSLQKAASAR